MGRVWLRWKSCKSCNGWSPRPARWFHSRELRLSLGAPGALDAFDLVHLDEPCLLPALPRDLGVPLVVHHHKLDLELARDIAPPGVRRSLEVARWRRLENEAVERSVHHVFCSPEDARRFKARHPRVEARVVENGFDPTHFHPTAPELREERLLLVLGSLDYAPNLRGLERFLREVWPPLAVQVPDLRLAVVGRGAPTALGRGWPPGVELVGAVDDVRPWLARATALVVPLEVGGGLDDLQARAGVRSSAPRWAPRASPCTTVSTCGRPGTSPVWARP